MTPRPAAIRTWAVSGIERARSARPVTWLTLVGVLLLPALVGGVLVAALYNPTERLENMTAAIVNLDEPVTIQDQYTPLGRQLAAGLVDGSDDVDSNLTWVLSNEEDAADGLADGTYQAVVTIPEEFSAAATSSGQKLAGEDAQPQRATIDVVTAPDALIVDQAITSQIAAVATGSMGDMLSEATLSNLLIGFGTLGDQLGDAADGATQLADGAGQAQDGAVQLADGATQLADGVSQLGTGVDQLAAGAGASADGAQQLATGAAGLAGGLRGDGTAAASGLVGGARQLADGLAQVNTGLNGDGTAANPGLAAGSAGVAEGVAGLADGLSRTADGTDALAGVVEACEVSGNNPVYCATLQAIVLGDGTAANPGLAAGVHGLSDGAAQLAPGAQQVAGGLGQLAGNAPALASGASALADGAAQSADGADQLAAGASELSTGLGRLTSGAAQAAAGVPQLADGATQLGTGAGELGDGIGELEDGSRSLADGLAQATDALPAYSEDEAQDLASIVADPVSSSASGELSMFGASAVPLLAAVVLWFGGLATFVVMRPVTARALTSGRPSVLLAAGGLLPAAAVGALQGVLVAAVVQAVSGYDAGQAWALFAMCALIGVAFAAVHQALAAVLGGVGRWVAALVGAVAIATGIVSTLPGWLAQLAGALPTAPAYRALLGSVTDAGGTGGAVTGLLVWTILAFIATTIAVARRRTVSTRALLAQPA